MTDDAPPRGAGKRTDRNREVDAAFGARIRSARVAAKISMTILGEAVGVSYQQMQKYESGRDRVSAGTLQAIATVLGVHPGSFFDDGLPAPSTALTDLREAQRLGLRILRLRDPALLRRIVALVDTVVEVRGEGSDEGRP